MIYVSDDMFADLLLSTTKPQRKQQHTKTMTAAISAMIGHTQIGTTSAVAEAGSGWGCVDVKGTKHDDVIGHRIP